MSLGLNSGERLYPFLAWNARCDFPRAIQGRKLLGVTEQRLDLSFQRGAG